MKYVKKRNELDLTNKFIIAYGIALGIKYLIEQEICYRDLKPNNILLDENYYPRICDFGLSPIFPSKELKQKSILGTPAFCPPEILKIWNNNQVEIEKGTEWKTILDSSKEYDGEKADVFSFGMILWCLFMERNPDINRDLNGKIERHKLSFSTGFPEKLKLLIENCCNEKK